MPPPTSARGHSPLDVHDSVATFDDDLPAEGWPRVSSGCYALRMDRQATTTDARTPRRGTGTIAPTSAGVAGSTDPRRPLYVAPRDAPRVVGSDPVAVLAAAGLVARLDGGMALSFVAFDQYDAYRTFFDGLGLVPRGDAVEVRDGGLSQRPAEAPPLLAMDAGEAARATRVAVDVATEEAVRPHEGAAVMLSGGLDSSVVSIAIDRVEEAGAGPGAAALLSPAAPKRGQASLASRRPWPRGSGIRTRSCVLFPGIRSMGQSRSSRSSTVRRTTWDRARRSACGSDVKRAASC